MTDWVNWHGAYTAPDSALSNRLTVVRRVLEDVVVSRAPQRLRVLSLCSGDGRDVLPVLAGWARQKQVKARLIELDPELADRARRLVRDERLLGVEVICGDAASPHNYSGVVPADVVVACGIFGNVSDADVRRMIHAMPALSAPHGHVVWTRHRGHPDLTDSIRLWFAEVGFEERAFHSPGPKQWSVGCHQLVGEPAVSTIRGPLFTFVR